MGKILSEDFESLLSKYVIAALKKETHIAAVENIDWENEAQRCLNDLVHFFEKTEAQRMQSHGVESIGVIDLCWNESGGDIEVDYLPGNDFGEAFEMGCVMNNSAIDNDAFFERFFGVSGEDSFEGIGDDYSTLILAFFFVLKSVVKVVVEHEAFRKLPKKSPCHFAFASFHDEERTNILTYPEARS